VLRNRMSEHTSHLAGLWIGAAISNTSHSNKASSTTAKWAQLTGKHKSRYLYFLDTPCIRCHHTKFNFSSGLAPGIWAPMAYIFTGVC
jgi:hypothetical protein